MNVDDHDVTASCQYAHDVVSAMASDHVCYHCFIRQEVLTDALFGMNVTYSRNLGANT